jgi:hypothetical protein
MRKIIFGILIFLVACSAESDKYFSFQPENIEIPSPSLVYPFAMEEAHRFYEEPFLHGISVDLNYEMITYHFQPSHRTNKFINVYVFLERDDLKIESEEGESIEFREYDFEIFFEDIITIYEAYKIAYEVGGREFFVRNSSMNPKVLISLNQIHSKETLVWTISFIDDVVGTIIVHIDAYTGDVLRTNMSDAFQED